ncbi:hypothetical protein E2320_019268 [Naja naja]|nr:hypothetical protein E2320_019268 [Naja naja]
MAGRSTRPFASQKSGHPFMRPPSIRTPIPAYLPASRAVAVTLILEVGHAAHHPLVDLGQGEALLRRALNGAVPPRVSPGRTFPRRGRCSRRHWLRLLPAAQRRGASSLPGQPGEGNQQTGRVLRNVRESLRCWFDGRLRSLQVVLLTDFPMPSPRAPKP